MRPARIDQAVPSFGGRDAIGVHIVLLRDLLRDLGFASDIWCRGAFPEVRAQCKLLEELPLRSRTRTWWLYHLSSGSPAADIIGSRTEPVMVDYHNITPAAMFEPWVRWAVESADEGRQQLAQMAETAFFAMADSSYNQSELVAAGYGPTVVVPPLFDPALHDHGPDPELVRARHHERAGGGADWLFVGRVAPSKAQHDLIKAFACYRRFYDPDARLHLVGAWLGDEYPRALVRYAERIGLGSSVRLPGAVSEPALAAYYASADVFVCASDHEGFCIPVVEAMQLGVPVVAYDAGAVAETAGAGALVLDEKSPMTVAASVHRVVDDPALRARLVAAGRRRAADFSLERSRARWAEAIETAVAVGAGALV